MLTWLGLLGRCLHMSMFALAQELLLSPLQIHVNLVLNPALCYMRVPGSPSPFPHQGLLTSQLGWSPAQCCWVPGWGGRAQVLIFHQQRGIHHQPLTAQSLLCFSSYFWSCQFSRYLLPLMKSPAPGFIRFCNHSSFHKKEVFSCLDEIYREMRT